MNGAGCQRRDGRILITHEDKKSMALSPTPPVSPLKSLLLRRSYFGFLAVIVLLPLGVTLLCQGAVQVSALRYTEWPVRKIFNIYCVLIQVFCGICGVLSVARIGFDLCKRRHTLKPQLKLMVGLLMGLGWSMYNITLTHIYPRPEITLSMDILIVFLFVTSSVMLWRMARHYWAIKA